MDDLAPEEAILEGVFSRRDESDLTLTKVPPKRGGTRERQPEPSPTEKEVPEKVLKAPHTLDKEVQTAEEDKLTTLIESVNLIAEKILQIEKEFEHQKFVSIGLKTTAEKVNADMGTIKSEIKAGLEQSARMFQNFHKEITTKFGTLRSDIINVLDKAHLDMSPMTELQKPMGPTVAESRVGVAPGNLTESGQIGTVLTIKGKLEQLRTLHNIGPIEWLRHTKVINRAFRDQNLRLAEEEYNKLSDELSKRT